MKRVLNWGMLLFVSMLILLPFLLYMYSVNTLKIDTFDNQGNQDIRTIIFLSDQQTAEFLHKDRDGYVKKMSKADLFARQAKSTSDYVRMITNTGCCLSFEPLQRDKLIKCTEMADKFFASNTNGINNYIEDGSLLVQIPWKLAFVCDKYEEGLPHTRDDVIFLSPDTIKQPDNQLVSTLIHEKVHIFQRQHKAYMDKLLFTLGYQIAGSSNDPRYVLKRSNPDINDIVYINPENRKEMIFLYKSEKPESIDEVFKDQIMEHPYEKMAYDIANKYLQQYLKDIVKNL
jgi:hypothetical protein